ncbi:MAG: hypothetical protein ACHQEM_01375 [Chitinophagales bacterium]
MVNYLGSDDRINSRTTNGEHSGAGQPYHTTSAFGLGDMRLTVYKWLFKPTLSQRANVQIGLGLKLPTGNYQADDFFYRNHDSTKILAPVSPPVQLGDGTMGITTSIGTFYTFNKVFSINGSFFYMFNPQNVNGVSTTEGNIPTPQQIASTGTVTSATDQFAFSVGLNALLNHWLFSVSFSGGGVPVNDVFGRSDGARKAGINLSLDPGVLYNFGTFSLYANVPILFHHHVALDNVSAGQGSSIGVGGSPDLMYSFGALFTL